MTNFATYLKMSRRWFSILIILILLEMTSAHKGKGKSKGRRSSEEEIQCHLCGTGEPSRLCNATSNIEQCGRQEICFTQVDYTTNGLTTQKGCLDRRECDRKRHRNDEDLCSIGVVESRCVWCCDDDNCNYDRFEEYSHTTPRPTRPPVTTTLATLAPATCDVKDFTKCITDFTKSVDKTLKGPRDNFPEFCQNVPDVFLCVMGTVEDCCQGERQQIEDTLKSVTTALLHACPGECSPVGAADCTTDVIENSCTELVTSSTGDPCTLLIREFFKYEHCITFNTGVCSEDEKVSANTTVSLIKREIDLVCNESQSTTVLPPVTPTTPGSVGTSTIPTSTTESPRCRSRRALQCITRLGKDISKYLVGKGNLDTLCKDTIPSTEECIRAATQHCSGFLIRKLEASMNFALRLLGDQCLHGPPTEPPKCDPTEARACITKLYGLINEADDFQSACKEVNATKECLEKNSAACTQEEKDSLKEFYDFVLNRIGNRCENIVKADCNKTITLVEGGAEEKVSFTVQRSPQDLCGGAEDCKVFIDVKVETGKEPECVDGKVISQVVVRQDDTSKANNYCSIEITQDNWKDVHKFILAAKLDLKFDGNQTREVTLVYRKVVEGRVKETRTLCTYTVIVVDRDTTAKCKSINDPHMTTFDGHYYNNFYEGVFTLYRHKYLPYEVQAIYQKCGKKNRANCNCGLAVKSGDFVFFADRCRKKSSVCKGNKRKGCGDILETYSYEWDHIPAGTRIFRTNGGRTFEILLPHGTMIKIKLTGKAFFNIWIYPSPFDWKSTEGLCGTYDGNVRNDLTLPDGSLYNGRGRGKAQQPRGFSKAWRVTRDDIIYHGVSKDPFYPDTFCECRPDSMHSARVQRTCPRDLENILVETCDIDKSGEIRFDVYPSIQSNDILPYKGRTKRQAPEPSPEDYDIDLDYEPPENYESGAWTRVEATRHCRTYLENTVESAKLCLENIPNIEIETQLETCIEDILITGGTEWTFSALDDLKEACQQQLTHNSTFTQTPFGKYIFEEFRKSNCLNDCNNKGRCENGKCVCEPGWTDLDCGIKSDAVPQYLSMSRNGLCSTRHTNCSKAVVFGTQFINSSQLSCHLQKVKVTEEGTERLDEHLTVPAEYFTFNQIFCLLPMADSFLVDVSNDGENPTGFAQIFVPHDPACTKCDIGSTLDEAVCRRKTSGHCLIDGQCYAEGEKEQGTKCNICNPEKSSSEWSSACLVVVYVVVAVILVLLVIFVLVIVVCCICCRRRKNAKASTNQQTHYSSLQQPGNSHLDVEMDKPVKLSVR